jgi:hypothetical protein
VPTILIPAGPSIRAGVPESGTEWRALHCKTPVAAQIRFALWQFSSRARNRGSKRRSSRSRNV